MQTPPLVQALSISKLFGAQRVLDDVSLTVRPGTIHAVVGENGAGKSTLAKCILGFYRPDSGTVNFNGRLTATPAESRRAGLGMVFQHFTLARSLTVAENLVLARQDLPAILNWRRERNRIRQFLDHAPFTVDIDSRVEHLAAGQKQKVEILKQLYLESRVLILDEPTSVLTPVEADEVLGVLRILVTRRALSVILITHKLREVMEFADEVSVLRRGRLVATITTKETSVPKLAQQMIGDSPIPEELERAAVCSSRPAIEVRNLVVRGDAGLPAINGISFTVESGEILGVAGISGNGQKELVQAIGGQREIERGEIVVQGSPFKPSRGQIHRAGLVTLPEEPLENATVGSMSVAENIALRTFDQPPIARPGGLLDRVFLIQAAREAIQRFGIRTPSPLSPIRNLSGGNVQRAVLARDLGNPQTRLVVVHNPCFGLDFAATTFVHNQLLGLRNSGGAVLLVSEDLDELSKMADRIVVMSAGKIVHETSRAGLNRAEIGRYMGDRMAGLATAQL